MKLAEAIIERRELLTRLARLEQQLQADELAGARLHALIQEIKTTCERIRDLSIAIDWTEAQNSLAGLPVQAHRHKININQRLSRTLERVDPEQSTQLWRAAVDDSKVVEAATWLLDLQVPATKSDEHN